MTTKRHLVWIVAWCLLSVTLSFSGGVRILDIFHQTNAHDEYCVSQIYGTLGPYVTVVELSETSNSHARHDAYPQVPASST